MCQVVSNLMGHEGPSSLLQLLRAQGLANALSSGASYDSSDTATLEVRTRFGFRIEMCRE